MERRLWAAIKQHANRLHRPTHPFPPRLLPGSCFSPSPTKMVLPHHTPYVTPHILHKNYAQSHDHEQHSNRRSARSPIRLFCSTPLQSSARISSTSPRPDSTWIASRLSAMLLSLCSTKMPSATRVPSSPLRRTHQLLRERRPAGVPRTSVLSMKTPAKTTSGGGP